MSCKGAILQSTWEASPHTGSGATPKFTTAGTAPPRLLPSPPGQPSLPRRAWPRVSAFLGSALEGASMPLGRPRIQGVKPGSKHPWPATLSELRSFVQVMYQELSHARWGRASRGGTGCVPEAFHMCVGRRGACVPPALPQCLSARGLLEQTPQPRACTRALCSHRPGVGRLGSGCQQSRLSPWAADGHPLAVPMQAFLLVHVPHASLGPVRTPVRLHRAPA